MFERLPSADAKRRRLFRVGIPVALLIHAVALVGLIRFGALGSAPAPAARGMGGGGAGPALRAEGPAEVKAPWLPDSVAVRAPDTLWLDRPRAVALTLAPVPGDAGPVRLTDVRHAALDAPTFLVEPGTPALQLADSSARLTWTWIVTPTEPGLQRLRVHLEGVVEVRGRPRRATLYTARRDVVVAASRAQRVAGFAARNWWWLGLLALLPAISRPRRPR